MEMKEPFGLYIASIFKSIDGEVNLFGQGHPTIFVRFAGCNLNCWHGCDTPQAMSKEQGRLYTIEELVGTVVTMGTKKVTITGGEPLLQKQGLEEFLRQIRQKGIMSSVETNGSIIPEMPSGSLDTHPDCWVIDVKCPSTGMDYHNKSIPDLLFWISHRSTFFKFVIANREDYKYAVDICRTFDLTSRRKVKVAFSPKMGLDGLAPQELVKWMLDDELNDVIFNLQIHKFIWNDSKEH